MTDMLTQELHGHEGEITGLAFPPVGELIATTSADRTIRIWNLAASEAVHCFRVHATPRCVAFSSDGDLVVSCSNDLLVFSCLTGKLVHQQSLGGMIRGLLFSRLGDPHLACLVDSDIVLLDSSSWRIVQRFAAALPKDTQDRPHRLAIDSEGRMIVDIYSARDADASGPRHRIFRRLECATGNSLVFLDLVDAISGGYPLLSRDGRVVALGHRCWGSSIELMNASTGATVHRLADGQPFSPYLAFSSDSRWLARSNAVGTGPGGLASIEIWNAETGDLWRTIEVTGAPPEGCEFSPYRRTLAGISRDMTARFWNADSGALLGTAEHHRSRLRSFSPDGRWFVTAHVDLSLTPVQD